MNPSETLLKPGRLRATPVAVIVFGFWALILIQAGTSVGWGAAHSAAFGDYTVENWQVEQGLPQVSVTSIAQTPDGYLWVGTFNGLVRFDGVHSTIFNEENTPILGANAVVPSAVGYRFANVPLPSGATKFPVVLYSVGQPGWRKAASYQAEELASHGYVVVACRRPQPRSLLLLPGR